MRSSYVRAPLPMAEPEPPQPTPFPIKIVSDPPPASIPVQDSEVQAAKVRKNDEFYPAWEKFLSALPKRAKTASRSARKLQEEKIRVAKSSSDGLKVEENAATSQEQAAAQCRAKVDAIVEECKRLNQKYRDAIFDLEASPWCLQSLTGRFPKAVDNIDAPPWIKRVEDIFDEPRFFIDGATATDVHQGSGGDCWFLASLMAVSAKKDLIEKLCVARDEKVGVYGFVFFRDGEWIHEVIDDKLFLRVGDDDDIDVVRDWSRDNKEGLSLKHDGDKLKEQLQRGGEALYFSHCKSNETWLPLIEKAYAKAHGDYYSIEGGFASEGIEDLTGGVGVVINPEDIMDKDRFWRDQLMQVNKKYLFGGGSKPSGSRNLIGSHAYAVLQAWEEGDLRLLKLRNPWGEGEWEGDWSDGSKLWTAEMMTKLGHTFGDDGIFWISYKDFLKHFPAINRVRLFDSEWYTSQQWTCVNVPWTVDYLDTKFEVEIKQKGPAVFVLSQPDDRYFYGLRGRYLFSMHFRLYKNGDKDRYIVRSMHNSGNETVFTRSVSAEVEDLEPGKYSVIFKITTLRTSQPTAEEAILKYAIDKKDKLLHVGRRFDYAQTKGNLKGMEKANRRNQREDARDSLRSHMKRDRKHAKKQKDRARQRRKRIEEAMKEKRKSVVAQRNERRRARQQQRKESSEVHVAESTNATAGASEAGSSDTKTSGVTPATPFEEKEREVASEKAADDRAVQEPTPGPDTPAPVVAEDATEDKTQGNGLGKEEPDVPTAKQDGDRSHEKTADDANDGDQKHDDKNADEAKDAGPTDDVDNGDSKDDRSKDENSKNHAKEDDAKDDDVKKDDAEHDHAKDDGAKVKAQKGELERDEDARSEDARSQDKQMRLSMLESSKRHRRGPSTSPSPHDLEDEDDSPPEQLSELDDDDFDWDSDIDGPDFSSPSSSSSRRSSRSSSLDFFDNDPWNAVVVLGLRVYSQGESAKIRVVEGDDEDDSDQD